MERRNGTALGASPERSEGRDPKARPDSTPDPEVSARPRRRRFTIEQKLAILRQADACRKPGELGALLRGEGLYSSHLSAWRKQRDGGLLAGAGVRRGPKSKRPDPEVAKLERENRRLKRALEKAQLLIELQKKSSSSWRARSRTSRAKGPGRERGAGSAFDRGRGFGLCRGRSRPGDLLPFDRRAGERVGDGSDGNSNDRGTFLAARFFTAPPTAARPFAPARYEPRIASSTRFVRR